MAKKLPRGIWSHVDHGWRGTVRYYDSKSQCYRVELQLPRCCMRIWVGVEEFGSKWRPLPALERVTLGITP